MYLRLLLSISLLLLAGTSHSALKNTLANNASPYLAMHGEDPVHWQEWNEQTVATARKENKLLFVSIGYFACHWCHVMQRESYKNPEIAAKLNQNFISVKVDRELNPALDTRLIEFVNRTRGYSGWPLNVFITPDGYPLLGIVYLPPKNFSELITELGDIWRQDSEQLIIDAKAASEELLTAVPSSRIKLQDGLADKVRNKLNNMTLTRADSISGGFGNQNKFPSVPQLAAMLDSYKLKSDPQVKEFLTLTLNNMANLGLNDIIAGGFYRYTVDPQWHVPHFEKMLYDNSLLASLYLQAAVVLDEPRYFEVARMTLDFMSNELLSPQGGLYASLSAIDSNNIEGGYYLWQKDELEKILSREEFLAARKAWKMDAELSTEDGYLPIEYRVYAEVAAELDINEELLATRLASARKKMLVARSQRSIPVDTKQLAAWNGLALSAFSEAALLLGDQEYKNIAKGIKDFLLSNLLKENSLLRAIDGKGKPIGKATLEDYAYVARGLLAWANLNKEEKDFIQTKNILNQAWQKFFTLQGWRLTETSLLANAISEPMFSDGPMPSPSAELLSVSLAFLEKGDDELFRAKVLRASALGQELLLEDPYWFSSYARVIFMLNEDS